MYRLTEAFPYLLNRVGVRIGEMFSRRIEGHGVTLPMYRVMAALWEKGDRHLGELREVTSIELSTLSRMVGAMTRKGLVSRRRPDLNARTVEINLTVKGRTLVEELIPLAIRYEEIGLRGFRSGQIAGLKRDLVRIHQNLAEFDGQEPQRSSTARAPKPARKARVRRR